MIKRLLLIVAMGVTLSGCIVAPLALVGPAVSGFTTASIAQSVFTSGANHLVKKSTGKSIAEHAFSVLNKQTVKTSYAPEIKNIKVVILPESKPVQKKIIKQLLF